MMVYGADGNYDCSVVIRSPATAWSSGLIQVPRNLPPGGLPYLPPTHHTEDGTMPSLNFSQIEIKNWDLINKLKYI